MRVAAGICLLLGLALAPDPAAARRSTPPPLTLTTAEETVRASQGSFCWSSRRGPEGRPVFTCGDYFYPLEVKCSLPVSPGAPVKLRTGARVRVIDIALISRASEGGADYLDWHLRRHSRAGRKVWRFLLPAEIGQAAAIDIVINGQRGDSNTWTGLATPACAALPPVE